MRSPIFFFCAILAACSMQGCGIGGGDCGASVANYHNNFQKTIPLGSYRLSAGAGSQTLEVTDATVTVTLLKDSSKTEYQVLERKTVFGR